METHSTPEIEKIWEAEWGGKIIFAHGSSQSRGIAILMSKQFYGKISNIVKCIEGRKIIVDIEEADQIITLVALYAPNSDSPDFFRDLAIELRKRQENKIIIGDFNLTLDIEMDRKNTYCNNNQSKDEIINLMDEFMLKETWRERNPEKKEFSWFKKSVRGEDRKASRIDFTLISAGLDQKVKEILYISSNMTDHRAIYMVIDIVDNDRGTGYWKLNTSLLRNKEYLVHMTEEIQKSIDSMSQKSAIEIWEGLKKRIKKSTTDFSRLKTSQDKIVIANLSEKVNDYEARLPLEQQEDTIYENTKSELEEKLLERMEGVMFRSKARWYEMGEKSTKYFYSLEKAKYNAKTCYKIIDEDLGEVTDVKSILDIQKKFYQELYAEEEEVKFDLQNNWGIKVPDNIREQQHKSISMEEIQVAIKAMSNNKTPGKDGIPVDFYKIFWRQLKAPFYNMVEEVFEARMLHESARQGILNLIPKPNKDARMIKNLRPITLLNTDYKIIEKVIANKILPALEHIIHKDQRGFMKNRRISVNIRKMLDIIHQAEKEDLEAVVLSLDFVKCFDKCSFSILHGSLEFFGFGNMVKQWTKILYDSYSVVIQNNGYFSENIQINKRVHQGGCCSSLYFLIIAEILAICLRDNQSIEGICIRDIRNLLNQFADDMDIFSICQEKSIKAILNELESFKKQSGFTVSYDKTTLYRIGSLRHSSARMYNISEVNWSNEDINVLGVTITHSDLVEKNYSGIITKVKNTLNAWNNRGLSLIGKVQVINSLVASLFVYKMMVLPTIPSKIVKQVDNIIRQFLWSGKKSKIAYSMLQNPKHQGGLDLVNLTKKDIALKASWPQILGKEQEYAEMVYGIMKCSTLKENLWRCSIAPEDAREYKTSNVFWRDVLVSWSEYNFFHNTRVENQIIWNNSSIRVKGKPVRWDDVLKKGLIYVYQLFENQRYKSYDIVAEQYDLTLLRFNSLKAALPKTWKEFFVNTPAILYLPLPPHNFDVAMNEQNRKLTQKVYRYIAGDSSMLQNKYLKWKQELGEEFGHDVEEYAKHFTRIYKISNVAKLRSFQYRLLQRGLVTNIHLEKWKLSSTDVCYYCKTERESITHLLCQCEIVKAFWVKVKTWLCEKFSLQETDLEVCDRSIIFNNVVQKGDSVVNLIVLLAKHYIYRQKWQKGNLNIKAFQRVVQQVENMEKYIAVKNERVNYHERKWRQINVDKGNNLEQYVQNYLTDIEI